MHYRQIFFLMLILVFVPFAIKAEISDSSKATQCAFLFQKKHPEALKVCKTLADDENSEAQKIMGDINYWGYGDLPKNHKQAAYWYRKAAVNGNRDAQYNIGVLYESGKGISPDFSKSFKWLLSAAKKGHVGAQFNVANMYSKGAGIRQNQPEAFKWYMRAANQGDIVAQYNVGNRYAMGNGVSRSIPEAYKWYTISAEQGFKEARKSKEILEKYIDSENLKKAEKLIADWRPVPE